MCILVHSISAYCICACIYNAFGLSVENIHNILYYVYLIHYDNLYLIGILYVIIVYGTVRVLWWS